MIAAHSARRPLRWSELVIVRAWRWDALATMRSRGPMSALLHGIAIDVNCSRPCNFWKSLRRMRGVVRSRIVRSVWRSDCAFFFGSSIVRWMPSISQPSISLRVAHVPSAMSFLVEIAGPIVLLVSFGPGNTSSMAWRRWRVTVRSLFGSVVCISAMKSST